MQIKRTLIASLLFLVMVSCTGQHATMTPLPAYTFLPSAASTVDPTNTPLPASIVEGAHRSGLSPEEIVSFYWEIHSYLKNNAVTALSNKIHFPLNECWRSKGDNIETKNEFIHRLDQVFTDEVISDYIHADLEATEIDMYGVYIAGVWFTSICTDETCNTTETRIIGVNGYCSIRRTPVMEVEQAATLSNLPDYSGESFVYGIYKMESYEDKGSSLAEEEFRDRMKNVEIRIEKANYSTDSGCHFGCSCSAPEYEFNKPFYDRYRALWYGIPAIGELIIICGGIPRVYFDILANNKIGYDYLGYYVTLVNQQ